MLNCWRGLLAEHDDCESGNEADQESDARDETDEEPRLAGVGRVVMAGGVGVISGSGHSVGRALVLSFAEGLAD